MNELTIKQTEEITTAFNGFERYLSEFGLPVDNVIAPKNERKSIMQMLPSFLTNLDDNVKGDARYISKFIAASAIGLFDAALNYVWNEVVLNLRKKVIAYGINYFFDEAVGGTLRDEYNDENDLPMIKDQVLLDTCKKLELIPDLVHIKLCYILTMRNDIGASHPNGYTINSYELLGWLKNCIDDVINIKISESALTIKSIIDNAKKYTDEISEEYIQNFENSIKDLSVNTVSNLLVSLFGIFVAPNTPQITQRNILKLGIITFKYSNEETKKELGKKLDAYRANLDNEKTTKGELFFEKCDGKKYFSTDAKVIKISLACERLENVHYAWDNYCNETQYAQEIMSYIKLNDDIPQIRLNAIIKVFLICRIGNDRYYYEGISESASKYYDAFFKLLDESQIKEVIKTLQTETFSYLLNGKYRPKHIRHIFQIMNSDLLSERMQEILKYLSENERTDIMFKTKEFKDMSCGII